MLDPPEEWIEEGHSFERSDEPPEGTAAVSYKTESGKGHMFAKDQFSFRFCKLNCRTVNLLEDTNIFAGVSLLLQLRTKTYQLTVEIFDTHNKNWKITWLGQGALAKAPWVGSFNEAMLTLLIN